MTRHEEELILARRRIAEINIGQISADTQRIVEAHPEGVPVNLDYHHFHKLEQAIEMLSRLLERAERRRAA